MAIKDMLLPEYDHEMAVTRRLLERAPEADFGWRPHEKSMSLGNLATHITNIPTWTSWITTMTEFDVVGLAPDSAPKVPATRAELLERFDRTVANARALIDGKSDPELLAMWTFKKGGQTVFTMPRIVALRRFMMNHSVHHRGQLSVYLRLRNVPLPAMYGPTADEG
ncbi:MAG TPA: DinB family protein [Vicinamibacterales bacterium]|nr:DinB family protein [Vicinamibacterales bacterium]